MKKVTIIIMLLAFAATTSVATAQRHRSNRQTTKTATKSNPNAADLKLIERAISGIATAQDSLCEKVFYGKFDKKALTTSNVSTIKSKADAGEAWAQDIIGELYNGGMGGYTENLPKCVEWYIKSADQGFVWGQVNLAIRYDSGEGVSENLNEAVKWFRKAAEQGNYEAQNRLGNCYYNSDDYYEAVKWYRKAAEQGHAEAMNNLGECYEEGEGIQQSDSEARKWYEKSAKLGYKGAKDNLNRLAYRNVFIRQLETMDNSYDCDSYFIHDISGDGIPELFVITGDCEMNYMLHIFTYSGGKMKKVATEGAGHTGFKEGNGCLLCGWGHMGGAAYTKLTLKNGRLKATRISSSAFSGDWVEQYDIDDYSPF
ncbi:MAG: sel1 repeat family protein [Muribaculaceae bacterium]|nr:sel1 repeat family protein [Muribaculaceae bacterium]